MLSYFSLMAESIYTQLFKTKQLVFGVFFTVPNLPFRLIYSSPKLFINNLFKPLRIQGLYSNFIEIVGFFVGFHPTHIFTPLSLFSLLRLLSPLFHLSCIRNQLEHLWSLLQLKSMNGKRLYVRQKISTELVRQWFLGYVGFTFHIFPKSFLCYVS